jgi:hypothetical protein
MAQVSYTMVAVDSTMVAVDLTMVSVARSDRRRTVVVLAHDGFAELEQLVVLGFQFLVAHRPQCGQAHRVHRFAAHRSACARTLHRWEQVRVLRRVVQNERPHPAHVT